MSLDIDRKQEWVTVEALGWWVRCYVRTAYFAPPRARLWRVVNYGGSRGWAFRVPGRSQQIIGLQWRRAWTPEVTRS